MQHKKMYTYVWSGAALSGLAMSTLAIWCRIVQFRDVSPNNFDGLAMSSSAFSVAADELREKKCGEVRIPQTRVLRQWYRCVCANVCCRPTRLIVSPNRQQCRWFRWLLFKPRPLQIFLRWWQSFRQHRASPATCAGTNNPRSAGVRESARGKENRTRSRTRTRTMRPNISTCAKMENIVS